MDGIRNLSPQDLYDRIGTAAAPLIVDVRRADAFDADDHLIVGAIRRPPEAVERWRRDLSPEDELVVYCAKGQEVGRETAAALAASGIPARYLEGGIARWRDEGLPTRRRIGVTPGQWVTRERPKVDRIACPWLVRRFIDPEARFHYVPSETVREAAARLGATPYDIADVEFGHQGELCSFDAFIRIYGIADPALDRLALIVRGADTGRPDLTLQSPGLLALSRGLSDNFRDDHEMLKHGMVMYDALYAWCRTDAPAPRA
jgi:rhodanese-related sulfurtransferase